MLPDILYREQELGRRGNPFNDYGRDGMFVAIALPLMFVALVVGLSLVGHYEDGWDVNLELLAIPFLIAALPCACVVMCWFAFCGYECISYCKIRKAQRSIAREANKIGDGITLTHNQICKLDRTLTAAPASNPFSGVRATHLNQDGLPASTQDDPWKGST